MLLNEYDWNLESAEPEAESLPDLLRRAARDRPDQECLRFDDASFTFNEVDELTSRLAHWLLQAGLTSGDRVAIMLGNVAGWPLTWLASAKAGTIVVPVNSSYQAADLEFVLTDSEAKLVITSGEHEALVRGVTETLDDAPRVALWSDLEQELPEQSTVAPDVVIGRDTVANFQYTSGTTGFPKACILTHDYWLRIGHLAASLVDLNDTDVALTAQPFSYMDPQWNTAMTLTAQIPLVVLERFSASGFWNSVREHGATVFYILGTMPMLLLKQPESQLDREHRVRMILCSGIPASAHAELEGRWGAPWREAFGMTESGVDLISPLEDTETVGTGAIGHPVPGKRVRVVDADGRDVAAGEIGEMLVSGKPMMEGYWNQPDVTANTIVDGWLHTGDLVTQDEAGRICIVGRLKEMIRRGGENISSAEVESVINTHDAVVSAAAVGEPDELFGEEVHVFIKLKQAVAPDAATAQSIAEYASTKLARFKTPRLISFVDEFPLTPSLRIAKPQLIDEAKERNIARFDVRPTQETHHER